VACPCIRKGPETIGVIADRPMHHVIARFPRKLYHAPLFIRNNLAYTESNQLIIFGNPLFQTKNTLSARQTKLPRLR